MGDKIIWICLGFVTGMMVRSIVQYFKDRNSAEEEYSDEAVERINKSVAEYRTYIINQWLCLLSFWFGIDPSEAQTKLNCPYFNQNTLSFVNENLEVFAFFDWERDLMTVKTRVYGEDEYITHQKKFSLKNKNLPSEKLIKFVSRARDEHYDAYELGADDVISLTAQMRSMAKGFDSEDAAKNHLFDHMADLMILMRKRKFRRDKALFKAYLGLVYWMWNQYKDDFMEYLGIDLTQNANGETE